MRGITLHLDQIINQRLLAFALSIVTAYQEGDSVLREMFLVVALRLRILDYLSKEITP
jgi:hypothetical protein